MNNYAAPKKGLWDGNPFINEINALMPRENKLFEGNCFATSTIKPHYRIYNHRIEIFGGVDVKSIQQADGTFISVVPWEKELQ